MLTTDCKQLVEAPVLDYALENIFRCEPILGVFEQRNLPAIDYLRALCRKLEDYRNGIQKKLDMCQKSRQRSVWSRLLQMIFAFTYTAPVNMNLLNAHICELRNLISQLSQRPSWGRDSDMQRSFESTTEAMNRTSNLSLLNPAIPDHETDKWTKMLFLTPQGRLQVVNRQAKFDYAKYTRQISDAFPSMGYWDIRPIANFLHQLSIRWTDAWLVRYLRQHGRDSIISRFASAALLSGPSPPRFVPVFARYVPQHPSRLKFGVPIVLLDMFLKASIERLLNDPSTRRKEHNALRKACEEAIEQLDERLNGAEKEEGGASAILPNSSNIFLADHYFLPFELACQSRSTKIVVNALDSLEKLISYGHLLGNLPDTSGTATSATALLVWCFDSIFGTDFMNEGGRRRTNGI
uniref:DCB domain-containing protein n=1 Tax=Globodera pallida TaxID=36090 RepID=A0A183CF39_GLOPA